MKKLLIVALTLMLCLTASALAGEITCSGVWNSIKIDTAGEHTLLLDGIFIEGHESTYDENGNLDPICCPAIDVKAPATKLTIILMDGTTNSLEGGYRHAAIANHGVPLVIRCQSAGENHTCTDSCGKLIITGGALGAGIGSNASEDSLGDITIAGGNIRIDAGMYGAGIGSGDDADMSAFVNLSGGNIEIISTYCSAGIGGGWHGDMTSSAYVNISGGNIFIQGGYFSAGIGGGYERSCAGDVLISGGNIEISAGEYAAGIGGGRDGNMSGTVTISGGDVRITGKQYWDNHIPYPIGAGYEGIMTGKIYIDPVDFLGEVSIGPYDLYAEEIEESPFSVKTDISDLFGIEKYVKFRFVTPKEDPDFSPEEPPETVPELPLPQTGDGMNFALLIALAAAGIMGMALVLRSRRKA